MAAPSLPYIVDAPAIEAAANAHLALIALRSGRRAEADRLATAALRIADRHNLEGVTITVPVFAVGSLVAARHGRPGAEDASHARARDGSATYLLRPEEVPGRGSSRSRSAWVMMASTRAVRSRLPATGDYDEEVVDLPYHVDEAIEVDGLGDVGVGVPVIAPQHVVLQIRCRQNDDRDPA